MKATQLLVCCALTLVTGCGGGDDSNPTDPGPGGGGNNHAPTVNLNIDNAHLAYGGTAQLSAAASDADGDQVTFTWSGVLGTVSTSGPTSTAATFTAGNQWGQASVTVTASDGKGGSAQATALTYIRNPNPPSVTLATTASTCASGSFAVQGTFVEAVLLTNFSIDPCGIATQNYNPPISVAASAPHVFDKGFNPGDPICVLEQCNGTTTQSFDVWIWGKRPEPDGGSWAYHNASWRP